MFQLKRTTESLLWALAVDLLLVLNNVSQVRFWYQFYFAYTKVFLDSRVHAETPMSNRHGVE